MASIRSTATSALFVLPLLVVAGACASPGSRGAPPGSSAGSKLLVAHRGASAYAPEHTLAAYSLAVEQGADYVEPDLQVTRDGVLICLHDLTLERTTDVEEVFPDRYREEEVDGRMVRRWYASDFTLEEVRRLDAGSWFGDRFRGSQIPTFSEAIELARGRAGLYPETKAPEVYGALGLDMERLVVDALAAHGLLEAGADPDTPVIIQSFSPESLRILHDELGVDLPLTLLLSGTDASEWLTSGGLERASEFASGIGPAKRLLLDDPAVVSRAHAAGLTVVPWTFGASEPADYDGLVEEMTYFLYDLGVDGLFTNNPDRFPSDAPATGS